MKNWLPVLLLAGMVIVNSSSTPSADQEQVPGQQLKVLTQDRIVADQVVGKYVQALRFTAGHPLRGMFIVQTRATGAIVTLTGLPEHDGTMMLYVGKDGPIMQVSAEGKSYNINLIDLAKHLGAQPQVN